MSRTSSQPDGKTLYFGYGSNLWKAQMLKRCPDSRYQGLARLNGYRWIINDRGYANVVATTATTTSSDEKKSGDVVWGLVYSLSASDEARLDVNEGVPVAYTKEQLEVDFWAGCGESGRPDTAESPETTEMLVYVDRLRTEPDRPKKEYVYRMNMGIADAVAEGMPQEYVDGVMREFIPEATGKGDGDGEVVRLARKQAEAFEDED